MVSSLQGARGPQAQHYCLICLEDRPQAGASLMPVLSRLHMQSYKGMLNPEAFIWSPGGHRSGGLSLPPRSVSERGNENQWRCPFFPAGSHQPPRRKLAGVTVLAGSEQIAWEVSFTAALFVQLPVFTLSSILFWMLLTYHREMFAETTFNIFVFFLW